MPTGVFIPLMVENDLLEEIDLSKIPNFANIETVYTDQPWDPGNKHSVCKDWGSTGWIIDKAQIVDADRDVAGLHRRRRWARRAGTSRCWTRRTSWRASTSGRTASTGRPRTPPTWTPTRRSWSTSFAPHIKAFDSYPGIALTQGNYALSQVWNGDARQGLNAVDDPDQYEWGLGAPVTELWMDNWCIVKGATHPEAAHAWINFILDPVNSLKDLEFHGYNTGITGVQEAAEEAGLPFLDLVFFTDEQVATFRAGAVNSALDRQVEIYNKAKAAAGG